MTQSSKILVTGASSGLGRELAQQLAARGDIVIATARREDKLKSLASIEAISAHVLDLTDTIAVHNFCESLASLDGLVLNAGVTFADDFVKGDYAQDCNLVQTNILANLQLIRLCLPALTASKGRILIIASLAGLTPVPYQSVYAGTKAFMVNFGQSLREELAASGVKVSVFAPGGIETEMTDIPAMAHLKKSLAPVDSVAKAAIETYDDMPSLHVPGFQNKLIAFAGKIMPRSFLACLLYTSDAADE